MFPTKQAICIKEFGGIAGLSETRQSLVSAKRRGMSLELAWTDEPSAIREIQYDDWPRLSKERNAKMKLSARNILPGKVVAVTKGSTTAHVKVELATGLTVTSSITNEAVDELALKVGDSVSAVIKSSDVMIGK
jgi:molybdopterin-binding protein